MPTQGQASPFNYQVGASENFVFKSKDRAPKGEGPRFATPANQPEGFHQYKVGQYPK
jgi:hypothetical protein